MKTRTLVLTFAAVCSVFFAAEKKPLTNTDIIKMVKVDLPESTILMTIQANPNNFDSSVDAIIELKTNGVSPAIMEAMLRGSSSPVEAAPPSLPAIPSLPTASAGPAPSPAESPNQPNVSVVDGAGARTRLASTTFKIVETKAKGSSMAAIASDPTVNQIAGDLMRTGAQNVLGATGGKYGGTIYAVGNAATGWGKKLFGSDEVTLTYVYAADGSESAQPLLPTATARFEINYATMPGMNPDEFEPVVIKLTSTPQNWRMVGAMKAKKSEFNESTPRELNIIEDRVTATVKKLARGRAEITPSAALQPGEYAIVLRPVASAKKKFMLQEFEQGQGEASVLRLLWDFKMAVQ